MTRKLAADDRPAYTVTAYRPNGAVYEESTATFATVTATCQELRGRIRAERGWNPYMVIRDSRGQDVTRVYDR